MAPPALIKRTLTSVGLKQNCGTKILTVSSSALVISVIMTLYHFTFLDTATSGLRALVPCLCRCASRLLISYIVHA